MTENRVTYRRRSTVTVDGQTHEIEQECDAVGEQAVALLTHVAPLLAAKDEGQGTEARG